MSRSGPNMYNETKTVFLDQDVQDQATQTSKGERDPPPVAVVYPQRRVMGDVGLPNAIGRGRTATILHAWEEPVIGPALAPLPALNHLEETLNAAANILNAHIPPFQLYDEQWD